MKYEKKFEGIVVDIGHVTMKLPNGVEGKFEIVEHPGGAAVVALDENNNVCMLRQYRPVVKDWHWEIPAGKLEPNEPPEESIKRELIEEAGREAGRWDSLGGVWMSPGVFDEVIHLYLARDLHEVESAPEEHECFELHWIPLDEACEKAMNQEYDDAKTIIGLLRAQRLITEEGK